jgi:hypothetical protein
MKEKRRNTIAWLACGGLGLFAALAASVFLAVRADSGPPVTPRPPALPIPPARGHIISKWSPDSRQLLVSADVLYRIGFPEQTAMPLPDPPGGDCRVHGFDEDGRPLVSSGLAPNRWLFRLTGKGTWKPVAGPAVYHFLSPDGRRVAMGEQRASPATPGAPPTADQVSIVRLTDLQREAVLRASGRRLWGSGWIARDAYATMRGPRGTRQDRWLYRVGQGRFVPRAGAVPNPWAWRSRLSMRLEPRSRMLRCLGLMGIPGVPPSIELWLAVPPAGSRRDVPLGLIINPNFVPSAPSESPDGRWAAVAAPDGTLRVLDLAKALAPAPIASR